MRARARPDGRATLAAGGARVDGWFYCPHHPDAHVEALRLDCDCRKPKSGHDPTGPASGSRSILAGRSWSATSWPTSGWRRARARAASSCGRATARPSSRGTAGSCRARRYVAPDLMEATAWILAESGHPRERRMTSRISRARAPGLCRALRARARRRCRRPRRRRVHLRPDRPRVARSARADPAATTRRRSCRAAPATRPTTPPRSARASTSSAWSARTAPAGG